MFRDIISNVILNAIVSPITPNPTPPETGNIRITTDNVERITADGVERIIAGV